jgi:S-formylglutathione hydrolase
MELLAEQRLHGGRQLQYKHASSACSCDMVFSVYLPPAAAEGPVPVLYWLSGLTCDDQNFSVKSGAQLHAAREGIALIIPDTSPRGDEVPDCPDESWDFGKAAGFYVNATEPPWQQNYRMYDYIVSELPDLVENHLPLDGGARCISGHSMGGHGALVIGMRNPSRYRSISAFAPIVAPPDVPWGRKALSNYLGNNRDAWRAYDASELIKSAAQHPPILIDQGEADEWLEEQLQTWRFQPAAGDDSVTVRMQPGYDHGYYFVTSFFADHLAFHKANFT